MEVKDAANLGNGGVFWSPPLLVLDALVTARQVIAFLFALMV